MQNLPAGQLIALPLPATAPVWTDWAQETGITTLAQQLNAAMADSPAARAAYLATWGTPWEPLPYCDTVVAQGTGDRYQDLAAAHRAAPSAHTVL